MSSDDGTVPDFEAFDTGVSMNANYRFWLGLFSFIKY
jgi:hypothetical protein